LLADSKETQELLARPARTVQEALLFSVAELDEETTWVVTVAPECEMYRVVQQAVVARSEMLVPGVRVVPVPPPVLSPAATMLACTAFSVASEG